MSRDAYNISGGASASPLMRRSGLGLALASGLLLLSACGENETAPGPGGVSVGEARALDEAAQMFDQQRLTDADLSGEQADSPPED